MKMGSRMMLQTAPMRTVFMLKRVKPWVVIKRFIPRAIITKMDPLE